MAINSPQKPFKTLVGLKMCLLSSESTSKTNRICNATICKAVIRTLWIKWLITILWIAREPKIIHREASVNSWEVVEQSQVKTWTTHRPSGGMSKSRTSHLTKEGRTPLKCLGKACRPRNFKIISSFNQVQIGTQLSWFKSMMEPYRLMPGQLLKIQIQPRASLRIIEM